MNKKQFRIPLITATSAVSLFLAGVSYAHQPTKTSNANQPAKMSNVKQPAKTSNANDQKAASAKQNQRSTEGRRASQANPPDNGLGFRFEMSDL